MIRSPHLTREVISEYETRIMEAFDYLSMDEVERLIDKGEPVDVTFGSSSYNVFLQDPLMGESSSIFLRGYCVLFAHTYAVIYGSGEILLITHRDSEKNPTNWSGHMLASRPDAEDNHEWVDFRGVVNESDLEREYPVSEYEHSVVELSEAVNSTISEQYRSDPLSFLDPLEVAFVRMVVDEVHNQISR